MAQLAIKGHKTRGKEVIEILEMLGGKIRSDIHAGTEVGCWYYIDGNGYIDYRHYSLFYDTTVFILEMFLEMFPYKVGDKVQHKGATSCGSVFEVEKMRWEEDTVKYTLRLFGCNYKTSTLSAEYLQPYKEENMEEKLTIQDIRDNNAEWLLNKLEGMSVKKVLQTISDLYDKLRKPQYPKTFIECCEILYPNEKFQLIALPFKGHNYKKLFALQKLLICRDAYWKIAGEQMGLDKPWKPDWDNLSTTHEFIKINKGCFIYSSRVLVFPTKEMSDAFFENFKELLEACTELL
jgi:hypothetical protein